MAGGWVGGLVGDSGWVGWWGLAGGRAVRGAPCALHAHAPTPHTPPQFGTPEQDALRRDFTINAMFYNLNSGEVEDFTSRWVWGGWAGGWVGGWLGGWLGGWVGWGSWGGLC